MINPANSVSISAVIKIFLSFVISFTEFPEIEENKTIMNPLTPKLLISALLLLGLSPVKAQSSMDTLSIFQHLYTGKDSLLEISIETDLRQLIRKKAQEEYQPAQITLPGSSGQALTFEIKLRARGNVRKKVCYYPPVKVNFKKSELRDQGFSESDKIKLVWQCADGNNNRNYLLKEYLIYRLYNQFTPNSFRVQPFQLQLVDSEGKVKTKELFAFLIEPDGELAARTGAHIVDREGANSFMFEDQPYQDMCAFQYMIGNTDWSPINMHNLIMLMLPEDRKPTPVPYDFDYSGMVDAHYAIPPEQYPIKDVRERYYVGQACQEEEARRLYEKFQVLKPQIMEYCRSFELMDEKDRRHVIDYLEEFFKRVKSPESVEHTFRQ